MQIEEYAAIAARLRELKQERDKALGIEAPAAPIVTDPNPPNYVAPVDADPWGYGYGG